MIVRHLYVHVPFCHKICPYCAFYKHQPGETSSGALVEALLAELSRLTERFDLQPKTIYFGGGTPTLLSHTTLDTLLAGFHQRLDLTHLAEWTLEANPRTFDDRKASLMRAHGVTRISLGVQSWHPHLLEVLGRDHSPNEARESYHLLRAAGFSVVNIDLMFSLPGQSLSDWERDLDDTLALSPHHISAYNLTYEEDTPFFEKLGHGPFTDDHDANADHFYRADQRLTAEGYHHYEISNYALPGCESIHNRAYWKGADYLGLGPSAVSTVDGQRWRNVPDTALYASQLVHGRSPTLTERETLTETDRHNERVALRLRTAEGIPVDALEESARRRAEQLAEEGVLRRHNAHYQLTPDHRALVDPVAAELFV